MLRVIGVILIYIVMEYFIFGEFVFWLCVFFSILGYRNNDYSFYNAYLSNEWGVFGVVIQLLLTFHLIGLIIYVIFLGGEFVKYLFF